MVKTISLFVLVVLILGGCATLPATGQENPSDSGAVETVVEDEASPRSGETEAPADEGETRVFGSKIDLPKGVIITYRRSGGFAGVNEEWSIYDDGRVMLKSDAGTNAESGEWQISPEQVDDLVTRVKELGFFELKGSYMPFDTCCDRFTHELIVRSSPDVNQVVTIDAAQDAPAELWQIFDEVRSLLEQTKR